MRRWKAVVLLTGCFALQAGEGPGKAAPSYAPANIVNSIDYSAGSLAPYVPATIFGSDLSTATAAATFSQGAIPYELAGVSVSLAGISVPLFYVSESQINFLVPAGAKVGEARLRVARNGVFGPEVNLTIREAAPTLFRTQSDFAVATHADGSLITRESPARGGEIIVLYAVGLGRAETMPASNLVPATLSEIVRLKDLRVLLDGVALDPARVLYAGITPRSAGLYQVNLALPDGLDKDLEVKLSIDGTSSASGIKLPVR